ncbi:DUF4382 domain-containing protein [Rheinheimera sp.]|uniref:DUF4382 domain-containing protein n=1 Tax=Rheinheimera sp. TaxID=1869214 RepID=UPI0027B9F6A8|nr:DUF4382 domain-containing protein [Rheinheimera sp.]
MFNNKQTNSMTLSAVFKPALLAAGMLGLAACGGGGGADDTVPAPTTATFGLQVSDAPVNDAAAVVVCFSAIELTGNGSATQKYLIGSDSVAAAPNNLCLNAQGNVIANSRGIDLLKLPGALAESLVTGATVPAGNYGQLRLVISEGSYIQLKDGSKKALSVPSNELKLLGPTLSAGGTFSYTLEFDLRKAVVNNKARQNYQLKPTGLRLVDTSQIGHLKGTVSETLLINNQCAVAPADKTKPVGVVYLYKGADLAPATLADYGGTQANLPYASAPVLFDGAASYNYEIGFIDAGTYTAAFSCNTVDDPELADVVTFLATKTQAITANKTPVLLNF